MRIAAVMFVAAVLALPAAAATDPVPAMPGAADNLPTGESSAIDLYRAFDLIGTFAVDCGRPASPRNPNVIVTAQDGGRIAESHDIGDSYAGNRYRVLSARRIAAGVIEAKALFMPGTASEEHQTLIMRVARGTRRTMFNRIDGGTILVRHGVALAAGRKTPVLRKCG